MKNEIITLLLAMAPVSELRGAIPFGVFKTCLPFFKVFTLAIIGNFIPCIPLYFFLNKLLSFLEKFHFGKKFSHWLVHSIKKRSKVIELYETVGLIIFVGIPLPITGVWTGTVASVLFGLKFKNYIVGVIGGILISSFIVSILTLGIKNIF